MPTKTTTQPPKKSWFTAKADNKVGEVMIFDEIGGWGVLAKDFAKEWKALRGSVNEYNVVVNSPGGSVFEASGIYAVMAEEKKPVNVHIMGSAWSAASWIAMAGDTVRMSENGSMMIHDPSGLTFGNEAAHKKTIEALQALKKPMVSAYAKKSGKSEEEISAMLAAETWFTAQEALDFGLVDEVTAATVVEAHYDAESFMNRHGLSMPDAIRNAMAVVPRVVEEQPAEPAKGENKMELTIESLRRDHPDLVTAIAKDATTAAVQSERARIQSIREAAFDHQDVLVDKLIADGSAVSEAVIALNKDHKARGAAVLTALEEETAATAITAIESKPDVKGKTEAEVRAEFKAQLKQRYLSQGKPEAEAERLAERASAA